MTTPNDSRGKSPSTDSNADVAAPETAARGSAEPAVPLRRSQNLADAIDANDASCAASELGRKPRRAEKTAARREAILGAALDEFTERGFALTRMEDVARRAGVGKGTIYLHFSDKEALFRELVVTMLGPLVARLEHLPAHEAPARETLERIFALFASEIYGTRRREVLRLVMTEGARFPHLAEFYYRHVVERAVAALRRVLERAQARGELGHGRLGEYPQLVIAPALVAILWSGLFERFAPLDFAGLMKAHLDILFGAGEDS
jgi:AcrR family transcriptional regulator